MIKVLWGVNVLPLEVTKSLEIKSLPFGGWVDTMLKQIEQYKNIELAIACHTSNVDKLMIKKVEDVTYYIIPEIKSHNVKEKHVNEVLQDFKPDILHMEGTEFPYTLKFLKKFNGNNIVSLQGILNGYKSYQYGGLPIDEMMWSFSPIKVLIAWSLHLKKRLFFSPRVKTEKKVLKLANNFLGRTSWDKAHSYSVNPKAKYYKCNRILRDPFYNGKWELNKADKYTIFIGNSYKALKGAHHVIKALKLLKDEFPNIKLKIAGRKPYINKHLDKLSKYIGYPLYLRYLIRKLSIENYIEFTGLLNADEMVENLMNSHVFVLPSSIENSPNTLGEAMLLGVPSISANVGGVSDMATDGKEALLFRNDDPVLLASKIRKIFKDDDLALKLSKNAIRRAEKTHNPKINANSLIKAYENVLKNS